MLDYDDVIVMISSIASIIKSANRGRSGKVSQIIKDNLKHWSHSTVTSSNRFTSHTNDLMRGVYQIPQLRDRYYDTVLYRTAWKELDD